MKLVPLLLATAACGDVVTPLADAPPAPGNDASADGTTATADAPTDARPCGNVLFARDSTTQLLFPLNEGTSTVIGDSSGHNRDGRFAAAVSSGPTWVDGKFGKALSFSGGTGTAGDRVDIGISPAMSWGTAFTIEMLVKPSVSDPDGSIVALPPVFALWSSSGSKPNWRLNGSTANLMGPALDPTRWTYVAATYDGSAMNLYVDGQLAGSQALATVAQTQTSAAYLGCAPTDACFGGIVDEVRVSSVAISAAAITTTAARAAACE